jgi:hypothetical protein
MRSRAPISHVGTARAVVRELRERERQELVWKTPLALSPSKGERAFSDSDHEPTVHPRAMKMCAYPLGSLPLLPLPATGEGQDGGDFLSRLLMTCSCWDRKEAGSPLPNHSSDSRVSA